MSFRENLRHKPARTVFLLFGGIAFAHALLYAVTGLSFIVSTSQDEARAVIVIILHVVSILGGLISLMMWKEQL